MGTEPDEISSSSISFPRSKTPGSFDLANVLENIHQGQPWRHKYARQNAQMKKIWNYSGKQEVM